MSKLAIDWASPPHGTILHTARSNSSSKVFTPITLSSLLSILCLVPKAVKNVLLVEIQSSSEPGAQVGKP